jgi:AraC-like DNA-binding protein
MMHNGKWNERQWERIEDEYQEPAREVVRVMHHEMRIPLCQVAEILYISESTLRLWCKTWKLETRQKGYVKKDTPGKVQVRARFLGYANVEQAIIDMRYAGLRWEDIQLKLHCSSSTLSRYIPESAKGLHNITPEGREAKRQTRIRLNEEGKRGKMPDLSFVNPIYR